MLVRFIGKRLSGVDVTYINLMTTPEPRIDGFDCVMVGGPVYFGSMQLQTRTFCEKFEKLLLSKPLILFTSGILSDQSEAQFDKAFSHKLKNHSSISSCFNGVVAFDKLNFFEKLIVWKVAASKYDFHTDTNGVTKFVEEFKTTFGSVEA